MIEAARHEPRAQRHEVVEGWILAGELDGVRAFPSLEQDVCGIPHVLRLACDLAIAGARRIFVIWNLPGPPDLSAILRDPRIAERASIEVVTRPPDGDPDDTIVVTRADRLFHRDMPKLALGARRASRRTIGRIAGGEHDAVFAADRETARGIAIRARGAGGISRAVQLHTTDIEEAPVPYAGFTARASGDRSLRTAERQLVWSLRKSADGIASKALNRHISLRLSFRLARSPIRPNHVTLAALALAIAGGLVIGRGGYLAGVLGILLVELGSIIDGVDGELARLRFQFSRTGQWLDTVVDDIGNVAYVSGVIANLTAAGVGWALPLGAAALLAFALTQLTQYALIRFVYDSGDLAAIPWAFQSSEFLSQRPRGARAWIAATLPKCLKRDFVLTIFVLLAVCGRLDLVLVGFAAGAFGFFLVFFAQFLRTAIAGTWSGTSRRSA